MRSRSVAFTVLLGSQPPGETSKGARQDYIRANLVIPFLNSFAPENFMEKQNKNKNQQQQNSVNLSKMKVLQRQQLVKQGCASVHRFIPSMAGEREVHQSPATLGGHGTVFGTVFGLYGFWKVASPGNLVLGAPLGLTATAPCRLGRLRSLASLNRPSVQSHQSV